MLLFLTKDLLEQMHGGGIFLLHRDINDLVVQLDGILFRSTVQIHDFPKVVTNGNGLRLGSGSTSQVP